MQTPRYLLKLAEDLFEVAEERENFIQALLEPKPCAQALLWLQERPDPAPFAAEKALPWQADFLDRIAPATNPGKHSLHDAGAYYCMDFSSAAAISASLELETEVKTIIDTCAAPGGKSIFAWRTHQPSMLLCNETIAKRTKALITNLKRCSVTNAVVISRDTSALAENTPNCADLVIVDAPCSGQSLLAKGSDVPGAFHPRSINMNSNRQKRIIANAATLVAPGGYLLYSTCTFAKKENEDVINWLLERFPNFHAVPREPLAEYQSAYSDFPCYRIWPQLGIGAGSFACVLQNTSATNRSQLDLSSFKIHWQNTD